MIHIRTPKRYYTEEGAIRIAGSAIAELGTHALIIGGKTALEVTVRELLPSLDAAGVSFVIESYDGECTAGAIAAFALRAEELEAGVIVGVGGGRILDLAKAVAEEREIPAATIPTVAATCAAWSALSIIYEESGRYAGPRPLKNAPELAIADLSLLAAAPARYLKSGIADTLVKWYENAPHAAAAEEDLSLGIALRVSALALEVLEEHAVQAAKDAGSGRVTPAFRKTVDAVILLAGLTGSVTQGNHHAAVAHAVHNSLTSLPETHGSLHGEKVGFGLLVQFVLEGKPEQQIHELILLLRVLELPVTLKQLGITAQPADVAKEIAQGVNLGSALLSFAVNAKLLQEAVITADRHGNAQLNGVPAITAGGLK
ncbi:iron-containing alcohol dehydrogenase family protein [Paenibacillus sp. S150]|uniref:iron-containing alcohol dehydrogenase family protein n=1 Tax=Paenibacillus sp. S150 TaxID=2749826 RepID=UPI001C588721|nr:iron-containing alcohol dehydrogenase family protein [Paenibacillus sp. S150]MBW4079783.1 iron-containing alcohol dehydrogenase family protein [Paenibacillus sp. S150]